MAEAKREKPNCFTPNNDAYPLCIGNKEAIVECKYCNLYEDAPGPYDGY